MQDYNETFIANDKYAQSLGIKIIQSSEEFARCELTIADSHTNGLGSIHGAVIFALADTAFAAACNTVKTSIGMQADIKYLNKPTGTKLIAEARVVSHSRKVGHYQVSVKDDDGVYVAQMSSIAYRLGPK
jgi:acyl-CoA thioesterase